MEEALNEFIEYWKSKKYVIGILLTGSYAVGLQNENSDIDIRIIFNNTKKKTIKGLSIINGFKFSYLGSSINATTIKLNVDFLNYNKFEARIYSIGKILYTKNKGLESLITLAKIYLNTPFIKKKIEENDLKTKLYTLYSYKNHLLESDEKSPFFIYNYYIYMKFTLNTYSQFLGYEFFLDVKTENVLFNQKYRILYIWSDYPDPKFINLWKENLETKNVNKHSVQKINDYIEKKIEKINEDNFKIFW